MTPSNEYTYPVGSHYANVGIRREGWTDGEVITPHGTVLVYAQGDEDHWHLTRLSMRVGSKVHCRAWECRYSPRYIVTLAKRFAKELADDA